MIWPMLLLARGIGRVHGRLVGLAAALLLVSVQ
jgi:hypothetical protein